MQITMLVAQNSVDMRDMGVGSSSATLFRTIGGSFGVSLFGALFSHRVQDVMASRLGDKGAAALGGGAQLDPKAVARLSSTVKDGYLHAVSAGTHQVFLWGTVVSVVGFVAALFVVETPLRGAGPKEVPADEAPEPVDAA
jgi:hypothetical protein